ncbi:RNA polymerase II transcription factor SIII subunit A [Arabidopsis thaliana x Arabidopsis arenosa]|uniref:RNA polymerase II transcription factor SIII subunit A n=1 Tax=Arabidopsis thaliana x Arabidopsis arenosa TaxID=1240361 RepID=A0A8T2ADY4_9BRAS|nr:RNA polymerase II transcription factor SIII subunit A [Arabidopsis thaliana x Arabidopsis arenosa]
MLFEGLTKKPPSLIDLCVRKAIDNVKYIGYVGGVDFQLLEQILQHCTLEQLKHIEDSTQDTDLSPVTDKFWKGFYKKHYGEEDMNELIEDLEWKKLSYKWRNLYELKVIAVQEKEEELGGRLKERYKDENERKQSRQTKVCSKAPPSKRPFWGNSASGYNLGNVKSNIMKKAKLDLLKSQEVKNLTAIKRNTIQKSFSISTPKRTGLSANAPSTSRSIPYGGRNLTETKRNTIQKSFSISAPKRTGLSANATSTSRSIPSGGQKPPPKRINGLPGTAPSTSKNAATRQKHVM